MLLSIALDTISAIHYYSIRMIKGFADRDTESIFKGRRARGLPISIRRRAERKLLVLNAAIDIEELRVPLGGVAGMPTTLRSRTIMVEGEKDG